MVALAEAAVKVTIEGVFGAAEEWNTGFWMESPAWGTTTPDSATLNDFAGDIETLWNTASLSLQSLRGTACRSTGVRVHFYPAGGLLSTGVGESVIGGQNGSTEIGHPYQVGIVCSLRTAVAGRRTRGRMYLPLTAIPVTASSGQYAAEPNLVASVMATFLSSCNDVPLGAVTAKVVVASHAAGITTLVNAVRVDSIPDIQRRRANGLTASTVANASVSP